jgi:indole-3-glycerol phosphate synthase
MRTNRDRKRARKQARKRKLRYLRQRLAQTTDPAERRRLIAKIKRISPAAPISEA